MDKKRTKKEFTPYNEYVDRGMSLKWGTAFELGELTQAIDQGKKESIQSINRSPQQTAEQIDYFLGQSIKYNKLLDIQLNSLNDMGFVKEHIKGTFQGFLDPETILISDVAVDYKDIRHIRMSNFHKWLDMTVEGEDAFEEIEITEEIDGFCEDYFKDGDFIE